MGLKKKDDMETIEVTGILDRIKKGKSSRDDLAVIDKGLRLLKITQESLVHGNVVHKEDVEKIGHEVGQRLKEARKACGISQEDLEKASSVSQSTISKIESGSKMISVGEAKKIAKVLKVTPQFLIAGD